MAKTGKASVAKRSPIKASKSMLIKKAKSAKSANARATPAKTTKSKQKWAAPYQKKIRMFK